MALLDLTDFDIYRDIFPAVSRAVADSGLGARIDEMNGRRRVRVLTSSRLSNSIGNLLYRPWQYRNIDEQVLWLYENGGSVTGWPAITDNQLIVYIPTLRIVAAGATVGPANAASPGRAWPRTLRYFSDFRSGRRAELRQVVQLLDWVIEEADAIWVVQLDDTPDLVQLGTAPPTVRAARAYYAEQYEAARTEGATRVPLHEQPPVAQAIEKLGMPKAAERLPTGPAIPAEGWVLTRLLDMLDETDEPRVTGRLVREQLPSLERVAAVQEVLQTPEYQDREALEDLISDSLGPNYAAWLLAARWTGALRMTSDPSNILRLQTSEAQLREVLDRYWWERGVSFIPARVERQVRAVRAVQQASVESGHPVTENTLGWIRFVVKRQGWVVEEIQSDLRGAVAQLKNALQTGTLRGELRAALRERGANPDRDDDLHDILGGLEEGLKAVGPIEEYLLTRLVLVARDRGVTEVFVPDARSRMGGPRSLYEDVPRAYTSLPRRSDLRIGFRDEPQRPRTFREIRTTGAAPILVGDALPLPPVESYPTFRNDLVDLDWVPFGEADEYIAVGPVERLVVFSAATFLAGVDEPLRDRDLDARARQAMGALPGAVSGPVRVAAGRRRVFARPKNHGV